MTSKYIEEEQWAFEDLFYLLSSSTHSIWGLKTTGRFKKRVFLYHSYSISIWVVIWRLEVLFFIHLFSIFLSLLLLLSIEHKNWCVEQIWIWIEIKIMLVDCLDHTTWLFALICWFLNWIVIDIFLIYFYLFTYCMKLSHSLKKLWTRTFRNIVNQHFRP